ncbi:SpoIIE family protein phosphatase [Bacillus alkalicellulosilyticus]|uniref:SpoIIE family protein phosphatase n=1 Tax=Alkalihalobacterium alkalicellulosilyticum TaxID=1912214 RepID=UPI0009986C5C|nr:SpoIIE family protein phosphatase [Bacillus alkalicellulosilyticus]
MLKNIKEMVENFSPSTLYSSKLEEMSRLTELYQLYIVDTEQEEEFDHITTLIRDVFTVPVVLISLITEDRQWIKSCVGINIKEIMRDDSICQHVIADKKAIIIENMENDTRFKNHPIAIEHNIYFYVSVPLTTSKGNIIGTLCIGDHKPKSFTNHQLQLLESFSGLVVQEIEKRYALLVEAKWKDKLLQENRRYLSLVNNLQDVVIQTDEQGNISFLAPAWEDLMGYTVEETLNQSFLNFVSTANRDHFSKLFSNLVERKADNFKQVVQYITKSGKKKWLRLVFSFIYDKNKEFLGTIGTLSDLTDLVELENERQKDRDLAKKVQLSVTSNPIHHPSFKIDCEYHSSLDLSGDMYYWVQIDEGKYGVILVDVMGHGIASSLVSMSIRSLLHGLFKKVQDPVLIYKELNRHIHTLLNSPDGIISYFTAMIIYIDTNNKRVEFVNAGHPKGLMQVDDTLPHIMDKGSLPIGLMEHPPIEKGIICYPEDATILIYTDGLGDIIGDDVNQKLLLCLKEYKKTTKTLSRYVLDSVELPDKLPDDLCVISIELN